MLIVLMAFYFSVKIGYGQHTQFAKVDSFAYNFNQKYQSSSDLAVQLTAPFSSDLEKARAIFSWMVSHVAYDCHRYHNQQPERIVAYSKEELEQKKREWQQKQIERTAKNKKGLCGDYSRLFVAMCTAVNLEAEMVSGMARDFYRPYRSNHQRYDHAWNAIKIDGKWHLIDATWGAGYTDAGVTKFKRSISDGFFMVPPDQFVQNHLPDDPKWQLLDTPISESEFGAQPLIHYGQMEFAFQDYSRKINPVKQAEYDLELKFKFQQSPKFFVLNKQSDKPLDFEHTKENGYDVFRFSRKGVKNVTLYGGNNRNKLGWLAMYEL